MINLDHIPHRNIHIASRMKAMVEGEEEEEEEKKKWYSTE